MLFRAARGFLLIYIKDAIRHRRAAFFEKKKYFRSQGWTGQIALECCDKSSFGRNGFARQKRIHAAHRAPESKN
jgi:hypothetical protein